jgi:hypothetical protein
MARINFGCREIEIVAAIGGLLKVLRYAAPNEVGIGQK